MFYCGIDWGWKELTFCIVDEKGGLLKEFKVKNSLDGYSSALDLIGSIAGDKQTLFGIETDRERIVEFIMSHNYKVYKINPNSMDKYRARYKTSGVKNDCFDAYVAANIVRNDLDTLELITADSDLTQKLCIMFSDRNSLVALKTNLTNQLTASLREYFPQALDLFSDTGCATSLNFLQNFPTLADALDVDKTRIRSVLRETGCYCKSKPDEIYKALRVKHFPARHTVVKVKKELTLALVSHLRQLVEQIKEYDKRIETLVGSHPDSQTFLSLPASATHLTAGMISLIKDKRNRFNSPKQIQALAGTAPVTISSGGYSYTAFRHRCNKKLRDVFTRYAFSSLRKSVWAKNYYNRKRKEGKTHYHALRCLANRWIKVIYVLWKNRTTYDENKHLASVSKHNMYQQMASPWT